MDDKHIDRPLKLYVYNHEYDVTREVTITPRRSWGGEGALGCVLGFGALHRVPAPLTEPPNAPGETLFDLSSAGGQPPPPSSSLYSPMDQQQQQPSSFVTPATMFPRPAPTPPPQQFRTVSPAGHHQLPPQPPPPRGGGGSVRHKARHAHHMKPSAMDAFMREEEQKSRELENAGRRSGSPGVAAVAPPPPRSGFGPPPPRRAGTPLAQATAPEDIS